jgi:hypothetical protein
MIPQFRLKARIMIRYIVAIIALILIIMRAFNLNWGIIPITIYSHQVVYNTYKKDDLMTINSDGNDSPI